MDEQQAITREQWLEMGFTVGTDGELYVATVVAVEPSAVLEFKAGARPITEDWCLCCGSVDGSTCMCESEDCSQCADPDCPCCAEPQEIRS